MPALQVPSVVAWQVLRFTPAVIYSTLRTAELRCAALRVEGFGAVSTPGSHLQRFFLPVSLLYHLHLVRVLSFPLFYACILFFAVLLVVLPLFLVYALPVGFTVFATVCALGFFGCFVHRYAVLVL